MNFDIHFQIEYLKVILAYVFMYFALPLFTWKAYLKDKSFAFRYFFALITQTFFVIHVITFLGLFHLYYRPIFLICLFTYTFTVRWYGHYPEVFQFLKKMGKDIYHIFYKEYGVKSFLRKHWHFLKEKSDASIKELGQHFKRHAIEYIFLLACVLYSLRYFGVGGIQYHSYSTSDIPVHHYWTHALSKNNIYVNGMYPMGMHCMILAIQALFGIEFKSLFMFFGPLLTTSALLACYGVMRSICKGQLVPLLVVVFFLVNNVVFPSGYGRLCGALPQESGFFSLFSVMYFLNEILRQPRVTRQIDGQQGIKKWLSIRQYFTTEYFDIHVLLFAMSITITFALHFYVSIVAFFVCAAFGLAYLFRLLQKKYFIPIMVAGILSLVVACLPYGIGLAAGRPFQGSIDWATSIITGSMEDEKQDNVVEETPVVIEPTENHPEQAPSTESIPVIQKQTLQEKLINLYQACMLHTSQGGFMVEDALPMLMKSIGIISVLMVGLFAFKATRTIASSWLGLFLYFVFLYILLNRAVFHIPELLQVARVGAFFMWIVPMVLFLPLDALFIVLEKVPSSLFQATLKLASYIIVLGGVVYVMSQDMVRPDPGIILVQTHDESDCVEKIIKENKDFTWTIVSPTAELYQVMDHGYHEEIIDVIFKLNHSQNERILIPTEFIYVFLEKRTMDTREPMDYSGCSYSFYLDRLIPVSRDGAKLPLTISSLRSDTYYQQRYQVFSRLYVWIDKFKQVYPNDICVYYETDDFVCYKIQQNIYSVFDLNFGDAIY